MIHLLNVKNFVAVPPQALATTSATIASHDPVDTKGFKHAFVTVAFNKASAVSSSASLVSIAITESDQSSATSSFTTISGCGGLTAASGTSFAIGVHNQTTSGGVMQFGIDLRGRKRYLDVVATNQNQGISTIGAVVTLSGAEQTPDSATEAGANTNRVIV
jgi:hypothetical protein